MSPETGTTCVILAISKVRIWDFTDKNQAIPDGVAIQTERDVSLPLIRLIDRIGPPCEGFLGFRHDQQMCAGNGSESKPCYPIHTKIVVVNVRPPKLIGFAPSNSSPSSYFEQLLPAKHTPYPKNQRIKGNHPPPNGPGFAVRVLGKQGIRLLQIQWCLPGIVQNPPSPSLLIQKKETCNWTCWV